MKVGTHAQEPLEEIIRRKKREIEDAGFSMWGYGGNTCHPMTMVQPFARVHAAASQPILLCMEPMTSKHFAEQVSAKEFSIDGAKWEPIPKGIDVLGSRFALCIDTLYEVEAHLQLADTRVALGSSKGKNGRDYIRGHVDKACLEVVSTGPADTEPVEIGLVASVIEPYAVLLR